MDLHFLNQFILQNFQQVKITKNGQHFLCRCPLCGDSKKNPYKRRFNIDWNFGVPGYHCFNCERKGNFIELYSIMTGVSYSDAYKELNKYDKEEIKKRTSTYNKRPNAIKSEKREEYNFNWMLKKCYSRYDKIDSNCGILKKKYLTTLNKFCNERKIPKKYRIYICYDGRYKNRIIIPIFKNKEIIYFQARRISGTNIEPKYDNPVSPKELCILNEDNFDRKKDIIITEGLIDAFMIGDQGTACIGKEVSDKLLKYIMKLTDGNVIIALDNDKEANIALNRFMNKSKWAKVVKYFIYPKKFKKYKDMNEIAMNENINIYDMIVGNCIDYYFYFLIGKKEKECRRDEDNTNRKRLHNS